MLNRYFGLRARGTSPRIEILGGATTFLTMAYIIVVNPGILSDAGIPRGPSTVATILAAVFGTALMGLYANRPIAVAPYMGENAFIAYSLTALGISWQQRLGAVFVSGALFAVITFLGLRTWLARSISSSLNHSFAVGIGLFLALIGLFNTGIIAKHPSPAVPLTIGSVHNPQVLLSMAGFLIIVILLYLRVPGAILLGIVLTAAVGQVMRLGQLPQSFVAWPFTGAYDVTQIAFKLDIAGVLKLALLPVLLTLILMSLFDTLGTLIGVGAAGGMLDDKGNFPEIERPMMVDAVTCMFSGLVGTSTSGAYIESATGIREGARTGLAALITAGLFVVSLFFLPLIEPLQQARYAYAPALIVVGLLMLGSVRKINFDDLTELVPAFVTIALMVFTYNIGNGLAAGLVLHPLLKLATGRLREITLGSALLGVACVVYFAFGLPH